MVAAVMPKAYAAGSRSRVCGCIPLLAAGHMIALLVLSEGVLLICSISGYLGSSRGILEYFDSDSPLYGLQRVLLWLAGAADVAFAAAAFLGLVMARSILPLGLHKYQTSEKSTLVVWALLPWRLAVTISVVPLVASMLASGPATGASKALIVCGALTYIAANLYILWILTLVAQLAWQRSQATQLRIAERESEERRLLSERTRYLDSIGWEEPPSLFGCFPLEFGVFAYCVVLLLASSLAFLRVALRGGGLGGWAVLCSTPAGDVRVYESILYLVSTATALMGIVCMAVHHWVIRKAEDLDGRRLLLVRRRCSHLAMFFFAALGMRYALLVPPTGMSLATSNVCGIYLRGLSDHVASKSTYYDSIVPLHCSPADVKVLCSTAFFVAMDTYLLSGSFHLWKWYQTGYLRQSILLGGVGSRGSEGYGAASIG